MFDVAYLIIIIIIIIISSQGGIYSDVVLESSRGATHGIVDVLRVNYAEVDVDKLVEQEAQAKMNPVKECSETLMLKYSHSHMHRNCFYKL